MQLRTAFLPLFGTLMVSNIWIDDGNLQGAVRRDIMPQFPLKRVYIKSTVTRLTAPYGAPKIKVGGTVGNS